MKPLQIPLEAVGGERSGALHTPSPQHLAASCTSIIWTEWDGEIDSAFSPINPYPLGSGSVLGTGTPEVTLVAPLGWREIEVQIQGWAGAPSRSPATFHPSLPQGPVWPGFFSCCYFKISWKQQLMVLLGCVS